MHTKIIFHGIIACCIMIYFSGCGETQYRRWSTAEEIQRDTVGNWLIVEPPPNARDIILIYDIDTNEIWEFFKVCDFEISNLPVGYEEVGANEVPLPRKPKRHFFFSSIPGWPDYLTDNNKAKIEGVRVFRCQEPPPYPAWKGPNYYYIAIDKDGSNVFAWDNDGG